MRRRFRALLGEAFDVEANARPWLVALFVLLNAIVLWNGVRHPPRIGYDAAAHLDYVEVLARGHLPSPQETHEYFSPPLPYVVPVLARALGASLPAAAKVGQIGNAVLSVGLMLLLLRLCQAVRPGDGALKLITLGLLGSMAVYAKTFAQVRGEPWVALLAVAIANEVLPAAEHRLSGLRCIALGLLCGLVLLARQWGAPVLIGCALFALLAAARRPWLWVPSARAFAIALGVAFLVAGWFYLGLRTREGSALSLPRPTSGFSLANQPPEFYFGRGNGALFSRPVRPAFPNQLLPIFYAEMWGDYWCHFLVKGRDPETGRLLNGPHLETALARVPPAAVETNLPALAPYLGRVNRVAVLPTCVLLAGFALGAWQLARLTLGQSVVAPVDLGLALGFAIVAVSFAGYGWFVVSYPSLGKGDTIKATYVLHVFPFLALMGGEAMVRLRRYSRVAFGLLAGLLVLVALHDLPTLFTSYGGR